VVTKFQISLLGILFLFQISGQSQQFEDYGLNNYRVYTSENGLPGDYVADIEKDSKGFVWLGTNNGIAKLDGSSAISFTHDPDSNETIPEGMIFDLAFENDSILWLGSLFNGLGRLNVRTGLCERLNKQTPAYSNVFPTDEIAKIHIKDGNLWISFHKEGIGKLNLATGKFELVYRCRDSGRNDDPRQYNVITSIIQDIERDEVLWFTSLQSIVKFNTSSGEFKEFFYPKKVEGENSSTLGAAVQSNDGTFILCEFRLGAVSFDPKTREWKKFTDPQADPVKLLDRGYRKIIRRNQHTYWLGSNNRGLGLLDSRTGIITNIGNCYGGKGSSWLCDMRVTDFAYLESEILLVATSNGLYSIPKSLNQFQSMSHEIDDDNIRGRNYIVNIEAYTIDEVLYTGYGFEGVSKYNFKTNTRTDLEVPNEFRPGKNHEFFIGKDFFRDEDGNIHLLSKYDILRFNQNSETFERLYTELDTEEYVRIPNRIIRHSSGDYYLTTRHSGVLIMDKDFRIKKRLFRKPENESPNQIAWNNYIYQPTEDIFGNVWIGTEEGLSIYHPSSDEFYNHDFNSRIDSATTLKTIFGAIIAPDSSVWIIDRFGPPLKVNYPYSKPLQFSPIYVHGHKINKPLRSVHFSKAGNIWLADEEGLTQVDSFGRVRKYTKDQGLSIPSYLTNITELRDGKIVFFSGRKLVWFHPDSLISRRSDIPIYIKSVERFDDEIKKSKDYSQFEALELDYFENYFGVKPGMLNFNNPDDYTFSYRLKGLNDSWRSLGRNEKAVFTNVDDGIYTLEFRLLSNLEEVVSELSLPVVINPPVWRTWWFRAVLALILILILASFYRMKVSSIKREEALKTEFNKKLANTELAALRAQMNPHFLFNSLNSIRGKILTGNTTSADEILMKFSKLVRLVLENSTEGLVNLARELQALQLYVEIEGERFDNKFNFEIIKDESLDASYVLVPPMLIQPHVENAIWHGLLQKDTRGTVEVSLKKENDQLIITIQDDGVGRKKAKELKSKNAVKKKSMGVAITQDRLKLISSIYNIESTVDVEDLCSEDGQPKGTRIRIKLPLIHER